MMIPLVIRDQHKKPLCNEVKQSHAKAGKGRYNMEEEKEVTSMELTLELATEAATYYCEVEAGVDEDTLTLSPEADKVLGKALEEGLCGYFTAEDVMEVLS